MREKTKRSFGKIQKVYITAGIAIVLVFVLAVLLVKLAYLLPWRYDMTEQRLFTLSGQSLQVLEGLEEPVQIVAVYPTGREEMMVESLLAEYGRATEQVEVEFVDAERDPAALAKYRLELASIPNGVLIVKSGERMKLIYSSALFEETVEGNVFSGEREITGAVRYVTTQDMPVVYIVQGHQETAPAERMTKAVSALELEAYRVDTLNLLQAGQVPGDADILIFPSPKEDLSEEEGQMLEDYLKRGGSVCLLVDPVLNSNSIQLPNFNALCNSFGVDITNNYVVEENPENYLSASQMYLVPGLAMHTITQSIGEDRKMVILPVARGLGRAQYDSARVELQPLLLSSDKSWARVDVTISDTARTGADLAGPVPLAYAAVISNVQWGKPASRAVVIGNSSFAYDGSIEVQANRDLWINSVNWLQGDRTGQVIAPKVINANHLVVRGNTFVRLSVVCLGVIPLVAFIAALAVWALRRNQ